MQGEFKLDRSFVGHILEGQLIALLVMLLLINLLGQNAWTAYFYGGAAGILVYLGREKRDCETGLKLPAGSPRAWYLMWTRWSNVTDMAGNMIVYAIVWAAYLWLPAGGAA